MLCNFLIPLNHHAKVSKFVKSKKGRRETVGHLNYVGSICDITQQISSPKQPKRTINIMSRVYWVKKNTKREIT